MMRGASLEDLAGVYHARYRGFALAAVAVTGDLDLAREAVQEGFARAVAARATFRGGTLEAWVWRIVERVALEQRRRGRRTEPLPDSAMAVGEVVLAHDPALAAAIRSLPERQRLMVFLRYYADLSQAEIAAACGVAEGTVATALFRARAALREALAAVEVH